MDWIGEVTTFIARRDLQRMEEVLLDFRAEFGRWPEWMVCELSLGEGLHIHLGDGDYPEVAEDSYATAYETGILNFLEVDE